MKNNDDDTTTTTTCGGCAAEGLRRPRDAAVAGGVGNGVGPSSSKPSSSSSSSSSSDPLLLDAVMVTLEGGDFLMGSDEREVVYAEDGEYPQRHAHVAPFAIDDIEATTGDWARFADATGYVTARGRGMMGGRLCTTHTATYSLLASLSLI